MINNRQSAEEERMLTKRIQFIENILDQLHEDREQREVISGDLSLPRLSESSILPEDAKGKKKQYEPVLQQ